MVYFCKWFRNHPINIQGHQTTIKTTGHCGFKLYSCQLNAVFTLELINYTNHNQTKQAGLLSNKNISSFFALTRSISATRAACTGATRRFITNSATRTHAQQPISANGLHAPSNQLNTPLCSIQSPLTPRRSLN